MFFSKPRPTGARYVLCAAVLCVLVALAAGCGGGSSTGSAADAEESGIPAKHPPIEIPAAVPPKKLVVRELSKGTGAMAKKGDEVSLQYYCVLWENGAEYANSWSYSSVPTFTLGSHRILRGLNLAIPGMREGGGREVIVPNTLVYYPGVSHPRLGRLAAVICKVYLVKVANAKS